VLDEQGRPRFAAAEASAAGHGGLMREHGANTGTVNPTPADRNHSGARMAAARYSRVVSSAAMLWHRREG
jgi:hypothetical protein